jgi:hypothetical protein
VNGVEITYLHHSQLIFDFEQSDEVLSIRQVERRPAVLYPTGVVEAAFQLNPMV